MQINTLKSKAWSTTRVTVEWRRAVYTLTERRVMRVVGSYNVHTKTNMIFLLHFKRDKKQFNKFSCGQDIIWINQAHDRDQWRTFCE